MVSELLQLFALHVLIIIHETTAGTCDFRACALSATSVAGRAQFCCAGPRVNVFPTSAVAEKYIFVSNKEYAELLPLKKSDGKWPPFAP